MYSELDMQVLECVLIEALGLLTYGSWLRVLEREEFGNSVTKEVFGEDLIN